MTHYLGIMNYKGGMGKTSLVAHLAIGLSRRDKRVLTIDLDPQGSLARLLNYTHEAGAYDLLTGVPWQDCITPVTDKLHSIGGDERLFPASLQLSQTPDRERVLKHSLRDLDAAYDYVLVDSSPSFDLLAQNVLLCTEALLVPVAMDYMAIDGLKQLINNIDRVNRLFSTSIAIRYAVPTFSMPAQTRTKAVMGQLKETVSESCITPAIRQSTAVVNASGHNQTVYDYNPKAPVCSDYEALIDIVIGDTNA